jgi:tetratricopeptide (TPR) repeat protein
MGRWTREKQVKNLQTLEELLESHHPRSTLGYREFLSRNDLYWYRYAYLLLIAIAFVSEIANASCTSLIRGPVVVDVHSCETIDPTKFDTTTDLFKFIADLDPQGRAQLINSYRGLLVKATVVRSKAIHVGLDQVPGAMQGEKGSFYFPPKSASCADINAKRIIAVVNEACCDGNGDAPCLLGTGLVLQKPQVTGQAKVGNDGLSLKANTTKNVSKEYLEAEKLYLKKDFKGAVKAYKKADTIAPLDIKGMYRWGNALREVDDCASAVPVLERIYKIAQKGSIWKEDELDGRRGVFLLARCHAKLGEPSQSVFYLNGFLLEPKKYQSELKQALKHKDFGWIHTSKEYQEFKQEAVTKIR